MTPVPPHLGILGGGQLAQMLSLAALPLGARVTVLEPDAQAPARLCAAHLHAPYTDRAGLEALAACDAVTLEFENVPGEALSALEGRVPVRPGRALLERSKHRAREKQALQAAGARTAPFVAIETGADLDGALGQVGGRGLLKTSELGYDGKGQARVSDEDGLRAAWQQMGRVPCVLEGLIDFEREVSLAVARGPGGRVAFGPLIENVHRDGILRTSVCLEGDPHEAQAREIAGRVTAAWDLEGLMTLEFFQLADGELLVNEVAPRVHNSGHLTQDGGGVSQFEAQVRAVLGLPLADWRPLLPCAMVNIIGVKDQEADWAGIDALAGTHLHLYHKGWRAGRKLGHVNLVAPDAATLRERLARLERLIP
ncbi:5-(carboxyamino)imidazole ribonucleotide synthase [Deinococcus radiopugnans]|uniref:N5-carboxyaminoimidazole ribonucleotide synthase n=1 Tax=Deinococcus radiopugnans ATCC 19172 TaxID=585398 RepID=A0A5C4Y8W7_9DEIO|nr:5-(carboxyamino)imidazole ribonucleotide synthase [Deinococcus radiopugnans]MBB6017732.1 5-(carboxyamino)imidazole ribonucleotide synthase [Deinococcus radiopugnans ATCC 19172]TNM71463.1 5-(carboxyamino)imidazole ribonucleotide synthase [Deinococcus radiopugnans ATCC 19172]